MEQSNLRVTLATKMHKKAQASALPSFSISFSAYLMFSMPTTFFSLQIIIASPIRLNFAFNLNAKGYLDKSISISYSRSIQAVHRFLILRIYDNWDLLPLVPCRLLHRHSDQQALDSHRD